MSFIDLYSNHVWTDTEIDAQTEAMIAAVFSSDDVEILNRKISGAMLGVYSLQPEEMAMIGKYNEVSNQARAEGAAARADRETLNQILLAEKTSEALASASPTVLEWVAKRSSKTKDQPITDTSAYACVPPGPEEY